MLTANAYAATAATEPLNTVSARIDLDAYLSLLALDGTMVSLGLTAEPLPLHVFSVLHGRR